MDKPVEVTQEDRDAASDLLRVMGKSSFSWSAKNGRDDSGLTVQAFARHRISGNSRAASDGETGWLVEEDAFGITHWIALTDEVWPQTKSRFRSRRGRTERVEIEKYLSPVRRAKDANDALRFARKEDAENFIKLFGKFLLSPKATEHKWIGKAPPPASDGLVDALKIAFWASIQNANGDHKYLDYDSLDEIISAAWTGFEDAALSALGDKT